jgi:hypothetical protein
MTPANIEPATLQQMSKTLGDDVAVRYCAPLSFYMVLRALGYLPQELMPDEFSSRLDRSGLTTDVADWSRPALSKLFRKEYGARVVSWWLSGHADIEMMKRSGYLESDIEVEFYKRNIAGKSVEQIVRSGYPVIVTMDGDFDHGGNNLHAIVIASWSDEGVLIVDPDARNPNTRYKADDILKHLSMLGAGSVVLPKP